MNPFSTPALAFAALLTTSLAAIAAAPDEPWAPPVKYSPVTSGSKSYRPVQPMPWGDVNRRVAPVESGSGASERAPQSQDAPAQGKESPHKQHR